MLFLGLFCADSIATFFKLFPPALLGVILMFGGLEVWLPVCKRTRRRRRIAT